jgi:hypothetical protein
MVKYFSPLSPERQVNGKALKLGVLAPKINRFILKIQTTPDGNFVKLKPGCAWQLCHRRDSTALHVHGHQ